MPKHFHGILSVALIGVSLLLGILALANASLLLGLAYMLLNTVCLVVIVYAYCCKCTCRDYACGHVFPGKLAALMPKRRQGKYSTMDILAVLTALAVMLSFPQPWLIKSLPLFIGFWGLFIIAGIEIIFYVCSTCQNDRCSLCKNKP